MMNYHKLFLLEAENSGTTENFLIHLSVIKY